MKYVLGVDFGTDSCRIVLFNTSKGSVVSTAVKNYPRWSCGKYCDPSKNQYRQHPLDYIETLVDGVKEITEGVSEDIVSNISGIGFDMTSSTVALTNIDGIPLALIPEYRDNPDAMFVLWKDHTAIKEAEEINDLVKKWDVNYNKYIGGRYSCEWVWSKVLHLLRINEQVRGVAYSWVEHCDWLPNMLCGVTKPELRKHSRCAAGHKAMWNQQWGGLPPESFFRNLDSLFDNFCVRPFEETFTSNNKAGCLTEEWKKAFGLAGEVTVSVGSVDCHSGAVGAQIKPGILVSVIGTSTCDLLVAEKSVIRDQVIPGICGQVDGSVIPGLIGFEAGQSAFGDLYAWFKKIVFYPVENYINVCDWLDNSTKGRLINEISESLLPLLTKEAEKVRLESASVVATDWINGRRSPDSDESLKATISGLDLGVTTPMIYRALVEATVFGFKTIIERYSKNGLLVDEIIATGGIAQKSPFIMQMISDVTKLTVKVTKSDQTCALGAGMFASVASGIYASVEEAQENMGQGFSHIYSPDENLYLAYDKKFKQYLQLGNNSNV